MPLVNCPECQKQVSDKATSCPNCGHPLNTTVAVQQLRKQIPPQPIKKKNSGCGTAILVVIGIIAFLTIVGLLAGNNSTNNTNSAGIDSITTNKPNEIAALTEKLKDKKLTKIQREEIEIEIKNIKTLEFANKNISAWDRSNPKLCRAVKKAMNDPDSFEHVSTTFEYNKNNVIGTMTYRCKNAFGAKILASAKGTFDYDGNLLEISSE
ncbi:zinc ribbon domain-containing protein [Elizabethkingia anophelis]|nr:zinc ribbon domain-containing protein [Elizabethkingia anophelis]MCT4239390.1 zinc ribbon domain-containing protein [Elizabethkingia anophelis]MCT4282039.1 zinc ribbon domain-containing protein [Elizabethkingia anophelis]MCT4292624.1 zinc ribbon domain-containing protein [Elizabethkingia anophelis]